MPGGVIEIAPKRSYNFDDLADGQSLTCDVVEHLDVSQWCEATLMVNVYTNNLDNFASNQIDVLVKADGYTTEDPSQEFTGATLATITINNGTGSNAYSLQALSANFGPMVKVQVVGSRNASATNTNAELSIRLSLKSCN